MELSSVPASIIAEETTLKQAKATFARQGNRLFTQLGSINSIVRTKVTIPIATSKQANPPTNTLVGFCRNRYRNTAITTRIFPIKIEKLVREYTATWPQGTAEFSFTIVAIVVFILNLSEITKHRTECNDPLGRYTLNILKRASTRRG